MRLAWEAIAFKTYVGVTHIAPAAMTDEQVRRDPFGHTLMHYDAGVFVHAWQNSSPHAANAHLTSTPVIAAFAGRLPATRLLHRLC